MAGLHGGGGDMNGGVFSVSRDIFDHPIVGRDPVRFRAWLWIVSRACWKPTKFDIKGKTITVERGQFSTSIRRLADELRWSKSATHRFLTRLKTDTMIETASGTGQIVITICNYEKYQLTPNSSGTASGTASGTGAGQERDTKEEGNKVNKKRELKDSPSFSAFWAVYPRRLGKKTAGSKFSAAVKSGISPQHLIDAAQKYAVHVSENCIEEKYIKHPTTWLNQGCWDDELKPVNNRSAVDDKFARKMEMAKHLHKRREGEPPVDNGAGGGDTLALLPARHNR